jgi:hypothetical protein
MNFAKYFLNLLRNPILSPVRMMLIFMALFPVPFCGVQYFNAIGKRLVWPWYESQLATD